MLIVFARVAAIFSLILIGFIVNKKKILPDESKEYLINLMLYVTAPCMAAYSIYSKELSPEVIVVTSQVIIGAIVYFIFISIFSYFIIKFINFKPKEEWGVYLVAITCINTGFMGFPITKAIFGDDLFYLMVMHNIILCIYLYGAVPILLNIGRNDRNMRVLSSLKAMINPCMIGILLGITMLLLKLKPPEVIDEIVILLSDTTIPLSMIIVGIQLGSSKFKDIIKNKYLNIINVLSMIAIPVLIFFVVEQFDFLETNVKMIMVFATVFPTAVVPAAIAEQRGIKTNKLAEIVSLTTFTSLITIPLMAAFLMEYYY